MNVGFVGLGGIGKEMVKRMLGAGVPVTVFARGAGLDECVAAGAKTSSDYAELAAGSEVLILCVYKDAQVREVLYDHGALAAMKAGSVLVNHTTGSPDIIREAAERAPEGVEVLDVTFSGGPDDVTAGRTKLMVGGDEAVMEKVRAPLSAYADALFLLGPIGAGQIVKLLNNLMFGTHMMIAVEGLRLAEKQGFDTRRVAAVISQCSGGSFCTNLFVNSSLETMLGNAWPYMQKDVGTAIATAVENGLDMTVFRPTGTYFEV